MHPHVTVRVFSFAVWTVCQDYTYDELLRHGVQIPTLNDFKNIILMTETSEEMPTPELVFRIFRALGERGILARVKGLIVGRPQSWGFDRQNSVREKSEYRRKQREITLQVFRAYNQTAPIIQNMDFGHANPQVPMPYGKNVRIHTVNNMC